MRCQQRSAPTARLLVCTLLLCTSASAYTITTTVVAATVTETRQETASPPPPLPSASLSATVLNSTNSYRARFQASPLEWNASLASFAAAYAGACQWRHSGGPYGENLAAGFPSPALAIDAWAAEDDLYQWAAPGFAEATGHFTQLVWQASTHVGCGLVQCDGQGGVPGAYLVCEYSPRGNIIGQFMQNVRMANAAVNGTLGSGGARAVRWDIGTGGFLLRLGVALVGVLIMI